MCVVLVPGGVGGLSALLVACGNGSALLAVMAAEVWERAVFSLEICVLLRADGSQLCFAWDGRWPGPMPLQRLQSWLACILSSSVSEKEVFDIACSQHMFKACTDMGASGCTY